MAFLKLTSNGRDGRRFDIDRDEVTIGRAPDCTLRLDDPAASGHHCAVVREGKHYTLRDLRSTNGTFLNGERISETPLRPKDVLTVGSVEITFDGEDIYAPAGPSPLVACTVHVSPAAPSAPTQAPSPFGVRRRRTGLGVAIWTVITVGLAILIYWFVARLLQN